MNNELDQGVVNLAKAIRQTESGGNFSAKGKSGEHGAYQFTPDTWKTQASKYGINIPIEQATPEQQNAVAYNKIKEWKDKGHDVTQIASMWNAGEGEPDSYTGKFSTGTPSIGINKFGAKYDVPSYAKSVATAYMTLKNGGEVKNDPNNPSSTEKKLTFNDIPKETTLTPSTANSTAPGHVLENIEKGNYGNATQSGIRGLASSLTGGGSEVIGQSLGTGIGIAGERIKGMLGGKDNSEYYDKSQPSKEEQLWAGGKVLAGVGSLYGGGRVATGLLSRGSKILETVASRDTFPIAKSVFMKMSKREQLNELGTILKDAGAGDAEEIMQAMKYLKPSTGFIKTLLKGGLNLAQRAALLKIFGDTVGGLIHNSTGK